MDIETLRNYCLSLSPEVEEKFPFQQFKAAKDILVFYIKRHMFCYFDINDLSRVTVKCGEADVARLQEAHDCIGPPYQSNASYAKSWVSIDVTTAETKLIKKLISQSFEIIKSKYEKKKRRRIPTKSKPDGKT